MSNSVNVPFETTRLVRDTCLCLHVQRTARAMARRFDDALRPLGLTNGQFSLLMSLNRAQPPSMGLVADLLAMDRTTLTAALKPLQRHGLIQVVIDPTDRRSHLLQLTVPGHELLARAVPVWQRIHVTIEDLLTDIDPDRFRASLRVLSCPALAQHHPIADRAA